MSGGHEEYGMSLTKSFSGVVQKQIARNSAFGNAFLREGIDIRFAGDIETGKTILRGYIKAMADFEKLGEAIRTPAKRPDPNARPLAYRRPTRVAQFSSRA